jgi:dolichol kinase
LSIVRNFKFFTDVGSKSNLSYANIKLKSNIKEIHKSNTVSPIVKKVKAEFSALSLLKEVARKIIHVGACTTALILISYDLIILELLFLPVMALGFYISEKIEFFGKNISFGSRRKWGGILLAIGLSLIMFAPVEFEVKKFSILILMIADVMAAIIGKSFPIRKVEVLGAYKSVGGSLAFAAGALIALSLSFGAANLGFWQVAVTVFILEVAEFFNWRGIDNVTLPISTLAIGSLIWI